MAEATQAVEEKTEENQSQESVSEQEDSKKQAKSVDFSEASETTIPTTGTSIDILLDMNVPVMVAIGCTEIPIQRLLQIGPGSVLKLDKTIDEPADLYLKDNKFATGTIVVLDNKFAIRITEILAADTAANANEK